MLLRLRRTALAALAFSLVSCSDAGVVSPVPSNAPHHALTAAAIPEVRISEVHYDNVGVDAGESIEISGPAGTNLAGWQVVLYNGNGGAVYNTRVLSGTIPATCGARGVVVLAYPANGIQNGDPDGIALADAGGAVVEFLSYGGSFTAVGGPAGGLASSDIGVKESTTTPVDQSLQRTSAGTWNAPAPNTFGSCNDDGPAPPPAVVAAVTIAPAGATIAVGGTQAFTATATDSAGSPVTGVSFSWTSLAPAVATVSATGLATGVSEGSADIIASAPNGVSDTVTVVVNAAPPPPGLPETRFSEIHYDNFAGDINEAIEVEGPAGTDLTGWSVVLYNGNGGLVYDTRALSGAIPDLCTGRGVVVVTYPTDGIQNGSPDGFALIDAAGQVVEFLSYEGTFAATDGPAAGRTSVDIGASESSSPIGESLQRNATGVWLAPASASIGACNGTGGPPPPVGNTISFSGRTPSDPALPVGFQDQVFATVRNSSGAVVPAVLTWTSETPSTASVDQNGVITALAAGTLTVRATADDGVTTATYSLPTRVATASPTAVYAGNAEFGEPADADPGDDFIVRLTQFTASWNRNRGTPNWVSYNLEATHFGAEDRCDCFTFDPTLPAAFPRYTTADYTGAGAIAGYGIDRGHLARSFDRTAGSLDNATSFYFTNIVPQAADLNQGPWAVMENYLGDLARLQDREVYIIAGVAGNKGTVKNEGKIVIPSSVWKVALALPRDQGLADVDDIADVDLVAVIMPNDPGVRNVNWETYKTTVDAVEALSGYDVLALLRDDIETAVESGTRPPVAALDGPYTSTEGATIALSAAASSDPDGDALTYAWTFGDGGTGSGLSPSHSWVQDGAYGVRLIVTDVRGLADTITTTATVSNVAPGITPFAGGTLFAGETYSTNGSFTDPGGDSWSATVDYGDGSGVRSLALIGKAFALSHRYTNAGTFTVTVRVSDDDASTVRTQVVTVRSALQGVQDAIAIVQQLRSGGRIPLAVAVALRIKLEAAELALRQRLPKVAILLLEGFQLQLDIFERLGKIAPADAAPLRTLVGRVIDALKP